MICPLQFLYTKCNHCILINSISMRYLSPPIILSFIHMIILSWTNHEKEKKNEILNILESRSSLFILISVPFNCLISHSIFFHLKNPENVYTSVVNSYHNGNGFMTLVNGAQGKKHTHTNSQKFINIFCSRKIHNPTLFLIFFQTL